MENLRAVQDAAGELGRIQVCSNQSCWFRDALVPNYKRRGQRRPETLQVGVVPCLNNPGTVTRQPLPPAAGEKS